MLGYDARQINTADKTVMNDKPLCSVLARSLNRKDLNLVDEFLKDNGCQCLRRHKLPYYSDKAALGVLRGVKTFKLVLEIEHLLLKFFLFHLVFVRQSHTERAEIVLTVITINTIVNSDKSDIKVLLNWNCF